MTIIFRYELQEGGRRLRAAEQLRAPDREQDNVWGVRPRRLAESDEPGSNDSRQSDSRYLHDINFGVASPSIRCARSLTETYASTSPGGDRLRRFAAANNEDGRRGDAEVDVVQVA